MSSRLLLVRHGQTAANIDKVWHGYTNTPLTEKGREQTVLLGKGFKQYAESVDAIYASPLQRAHNTALQIASAYGVTVSLDERLKEFNAGDWEGKSFAEMQSKHDFFNRLLSDPFHAPPNGESRHIVTQRFVAAADEIMNKHPNQTIVMVAHGVAISLAIAHWLHGDTSRLMEYRMDNTAVSEIDINAGKLVRFNDTDHLP